MTSNYISIDLIFEKLHNSKIPGTYWNDDEIKEWIYDALSKINTSKTKIYDVVTIEISEGKGKIPAFIETIDKVFNEDELELHIPVGNSILAENTYLINNGFIYVSFEKGFVLMYYYKFPIDEQGNPLIPDEEYFISAIMAYLRFKLGERAYFQNQILEHQFRYLEQKWLFRLPSAQASSKTDIYKDSKRFRNIHNKHII